MTDQPSADEIVTDLLHLLDVENHGEDQFQGRRKKGGVGRVFGGQVIGQALASAERTVPEDRPVHSLHAYFLRGGSEDHEIDFRVERDFDGSSFSNRRIVASQLGQPILTMSASFHRHEPGFNHADPMPAVPPPHDLPEEAERHRPFAHELPKAARAIAGRRRPIELRPVERSMFDSDPAPPVARTWFRCVAPLPDDPKVHRAILAYASDMTLLHTAALPHDLRWTKRNFMAASLDHAVWFHDDFRADDWLLYACDSPWAGGARGFARGRIYASDGRLVAEAAQEGLIRPIAPRESAVSRP